MKLLKHVSQALISLVDSSAKVITKNVPELGGAVYNASLMVNETTKTAAQEMLMENRATVNKLRKETKLSDEEMSAIDKRLEY